MAAFVDMVAAGSHNQTAEYIAEQVISVVEKHKLQDKFAAIVTDTPNVMKAAVKIIQQTYPKVIAIGCGCHVLDLFLKDLTKLKEVS